MAKIPRLDPGSRPSAIPGGALSDGGFGSLAQGVQSLAGLAGDVGQVMSQDEARQAKQLRDVMEARQAVVNETTVGKLATDFEQSARVKADEILAKFPDSPEEALPAYRKVLEEESDRIAKAGVLNGEQALGFARSSNAIANASMDRLYAASRVQQNQKIRDNVAVQENQFQNDGRILNNERDLAVHLARGKEQLFPQLLAIHGADAGKEWARIVSETTEGAVRNLSRTDPIAARQWLEQRKGSLVASLKSTEINRLIDGTKQDYAGLETTATLDALSDGVKESSGIAQVYSAMKSNTEDAGALIVAKRRQLQAGRELVKAFPQFESEARKKQLEIYDKRLAVLDMLEKGNRSRKGFSVSDNIKTKGELLAEHDALVLGKGVNAVLQDDVMLDKVLDHQYNIAKARASGKISEATFNLWNTDLARVLPSAAANEGENTSGAAWYSLRRTDARRVGNYTMNNSSDFQNMSEEMKIEARMKFMELYGIAHDNGPVTTDMGKRIALQALSIVSQHDVPGAWNK